MLWEKEYIDLSETLKPRYLDITTYILLQKCEKDDAIALEKRKEGNVLFGEQKWVKAMEKYNESLCFATSSNTVSLAYANRASCFLHMGLPSECLIDIEFAKIAGYPENLMPKLDQRKADCLKLMQPNPKTNVKNSANFGAKLSFEPHKQFPCMADVLKIDKDGKGDFRVIATKNIDVGKTILVDEPFEKYIYRNRGRKCNICLKGNINLRPCEKCSIALFCTSCLTNDLHEYECGISCSPNLMPNGNTMHLVRGILMAIRLFPNIDKLIEFVEQAIQSNRKEIPSDLVSAKSKYRAFLKLSTNLKKISDEIFGDTNVRDFFMAWEVLKNIPKLKKTLQLKKHRNFLMHLLFHHVQIRDKNIHRVRPWWLDEFEDEVELSYFFGRTAVMEPYFQRSCAPNVLYTDCDANSVYITVRPIKKGEQILISGSNFLNPQAASVLWDVICKCKRCRGNTATPAQQLRLESDPDFHDIEQSYKDLNQTFNDDKKLQAVINKCIAFQRKYSGVFWTYEIQRAMEIFIHLTAIRLVNPVYEERVFGSYYNL